MDVEIFKFLKSFDNYNKASKGQGKGVTFLT